MRMKVTDQNSLIEFGMLNKCISSTKNRGEITDDDAETLTFFLELVKESLIARGMANS
jgi:hypothetical protein